MVEMIVKKLVDVVGILVDILFMQMKEVGLLYMDVGEGVLDE